jgi:hypothetical protein
MYFRVGYKVSATVLQSRGEVYGYASRESFYALLVVGGTLVGQYWELSGVSVAVLFALAGHFTVLSVAGMARLDVRFAAFLRLHAQGLALALFYGSLCWGVSKILLRFMLPSPAVLFVTLALLASVSGVLLVRFPVLVAGRDNQWLIEALQGMMAPRNPLLHRFAGWVGKRA